MTKSKAARIETYTNGLREFVAGQAGVPAAEVEVRDLRPMGGGASRLLWSLDLELPGSEGERRSLELVMRQDPPGRVVAGGMELEFELLRAAAQVGVPVPEVYWCSGDGEPLGSPFFLMERLPGEAIARRLLRNDEYAKAREVMTQQLGAILARIHRIDIEADDVARRIAKPPEGVSPALVEVDRLSQGIRGFAVEPHPVLDLAERWLRARLPAERPVGFVHGDYRIGNVLFDESGTRAILDWELAHAGDPVEDLGWFCVRAWRFGNDALAAGGIGTREDLVRAYEDAGGAAVDRDALRFWEVCGNMKLALVFITQARAYLDGGHRTVELASLGRRTAEAEEELLRLMEEAG